MDTVLIILGVLGFSAVIIAAYVVSVATRTYVSDDKAPRGSGPAGRRFIERSPKDRRSGVAVTFPMMIDGMLVTEDRRTSSDRRTIAA